MKITVELEQKDFNHMYDIIYDVTGIDPTDAQMQAIWDELPHDIQSCGIEWGTSDTLFRDKLYKFLIDKKNA